MTGHVRKRKTKNGTSWQVVLDKGVDVNGKRIREYITVKGNKGQAQDELAKRISEYNSGSYIAPSKMTVQMLIDQWLTVYAVPQLAPSTVRGYKVNFDKHTIPYIGHILVQKLTGIEIQHMYTQLSQIGLSPRSVRYVHTTLREVLQYAYKTRLISLNPADFVSAPKQGKYKAEVYNTDEVAKLLSCAKGTDMEIPLMVDLETGLRRGELLALKWSDINWDEQTITIYRNLVCINGEHKFGSPKTKSGNRKLLLSESLIEKLRQHRVRQNKIRLQLGSTYKNNDLICCRDDGSPYHTGSFSHKFANFLKKHGLKHIRLHDIRHTNATMMLENGIPAKIASERLGHSGIAITLDTYSHVSPKMQKDAVEKLSGEIFLPEAE
ncbi:site-specific integrase [Oscillospiraceae bacterium LTW-04]|nr:tyrosine-type recombinase/integrase [Oscillospiraceae bacterium MB24-C1]